MPREPFPLNAVQRDRAVGALLATAAGDALGAGYALRPPIPAGDPVDMIGRGAYAPGEWTDATAMAIAVAELASVSGNLTAPQRLDDLVRRWGWWARTAKSVGPQTAAVLAAIPGDCTDSAAQAFRDTAAALYADTGRTLDGTCLTRAVPVALVTLDPADERSAVRTARTLCALTHAGPDAAEATVLCTLAIRHAVLTGELDLRIGLAHLDEDRRELWSQRIAEAEGSRPADFADATDDVVAVLQAAWSAVTTTAVPQQDPGAGVFTADHLRLALEAAVRGGGHTDTVAAVAGGLLGAAYGASALPWQWRPILRGWPGLKAHGLAGLADKIVNGGDPCRIRGFGMWRDKPDPRRHPHDDGVLIGVGARLEKLPKVEAVVSLCPISDEDMPTGVIHLEVRLAAEAGDRFANDSGDDASANAHLDFVLLDTVRAIEALRADGITVFVHGRETRNRAPVVAALYGARRAGIDVDQALADVCEVLPGAEPTNEYLAALHRLAGERSIR